MTNANGRTMAQTTDIDAGEESETTKQIAAMKNKKAMQMSQTKEGRPSLVKGRRQVKAQAKAFSYGKTIDTDCDDKKVM